jgi:hypothetical protein
MGAPESTQASHLLHRWNPNRRPPTVWLTYLTRAPSKPARVGEEVGERPETEKNEREESSVEGEEHSSVL